MPVLAKLKLSSFLTMAAFRRIQAARINTETALAMLDSSFDGSESEDAPDGDAFAATTDPGDKESEIEEQLRTGSSSDGYTAGAEVSDGSFGPVEVGSPSRSAESSVSGSVPGETPSREEQSHETVGGQATDQGGEGDSEDEEEPSEEAEIEDGETPKSRKRVRRVHRWKKSKRIKRRNSGRSYTSAPGKPVSALKHFLFYTFTGLLMCRSLHDPLMTHPVAVVCDVTRSCP